MDNSKHPFGLCCVTFWTMRLSEMHVYLEGIKAWQGHFYQRLMSSSFWGEAVQQLSKVQQ